MAKAVPVVLMVTLELLEILVVEMVEAVLHGRTLKEPGQAEQAECLAVRAGAVVPPLILEKLVVLAEQEPEAR